MYPDEIKERIEKGMGCHSYIGKGWYDLVIKLDADIAKLCPDYRIDQIKEKFGTLRFYIGGVPTDVFDEIYALINKVEEASGSICDVCGKTGKTIGINGWMLTRCDKHATNQS